jgi:flagellar biosynthetic protein FliR
MLGFLIAPHIPVTSLEQIDLLGLLGLGIAEITFGLLLGFVSRMIFYAIEVAGGMIATQIGLMIPSGINPLSSSSTSEMAAVLQYLGAMLFLALNLHHSLLIAFQRSYAFLPVGGGSLHESLLLDVVSRTSYMFWFGIQMSAPILAVTFLITLTLSVLGRAVPQMNVFTESFSFRLMAGLTVFGLSCQLMGEHIVNYLRRLPEDVLRVAQLLNL